jgi:hypothetical protein
MTFAHQDKLGRDLAIDDAVAFPHHNGLLVGKVTKLNPKMISIQSVDTHRRKWNDSDYRKYPQETVRLDAVDLTVYILRNA